MRIGLFLRIALSSAALTICAANARASPQCSLAGAAGAKVSVAGTTIEPPALLPDCNGIKVISGKVTACVQDERNRLSCRTFSSGTTMNEGDLETAGSERGLLVALLELLKGGSTIASAVTREANTGLPTGPVVLVQGRVDVDFSLPALNGIEYLDFHDTATGDRIARVQSKGPHSVDAALFRSGRSYRWTLASPVPMLAPSGRFIIQDPTLSRRVLEQVQQIAASGADQAAQALMLATWLDEQGLTYDAQATLRQAGFAQR